MKDWIDVTRAAALALAGTLALGACADETGVEDEPVVDEEAIAEPAAAPVWALGGFQAPESVLWDAEADVYLVSNINGEPTTEDDNGFISRVSPAGELLERRWITGADEGTTLDAPKGMAVFGDTLFVSDVDAVRLFDRATGEPLGSWSVPDAEFLNDIAIGPEGTLYATDSGANVIYEFSPEGERSILARGEALGQPNGVWADPAGVIVAAMGTGEVYRLDPETGARTDLPEPGPGMLDGVVRLEAGPLLVSSWDGEAVYRITLAEGTEAVVEGVTAPADIGLDRARGRVLVPQLTQNRVSVWAVPAAD